MMKKLYTTELISKWVKELSFEQIPDQTVEYAKLQILSMLAACLEGSKTEKGKTLIQATNSKALPQFPNKSQTTNPKQIPNSNGQSQILNFMVSGVEPPNPPVPESQSPDSPIPNGKNILHSAFRTPHSAFFLLSSLSMILDYDDYLFAGHTGHSSVLVPLTLSEKYKFNGKEFLTSQICANEIEARFGMSCLIGPQNGQLWSFLHLIGAAITYAKILNFSYEEIINAFSLSLYQPNLALYPGFMGGDSKIFTASIPAVNGILCAELAKAGFRGEKSIIDADKGFLSRFSYIPLKSAFEGLGEVWLTNTLSYKIYPGCAYVDSPIDCVFKIIKNHDIDPENIKKINLWTNAVTNLMDSLSKPYIKGENTNPVTLNFFTPYNIAVTILDKELTYKQFTTRRIKDKKIWQLVKKIKIHHSVKLTKKMMKSIGFPTYSPFSKGGFRGINNLEFSMPSQLEVILQNGKKYTASQDIPYGACGRDFEETKELVIEKFKNCAKGLIPKNKTEKIMDIVLNFESANHAKIKQMLDFSG